MKTIGVIGLGEAGIAISAGLAGSRKVSVIGYDIRLAHQTAGDTLRAAIDSVGIRTTDSIEQLVEDADIVISLVTAAAAIPVAEQVAPGLRSEQLYVDANSASPAAMQTIASLIVGTGAGFVDIAVMAAVSPLGHRTPMLASGPDAKTLVDQLRGAGTQIEVVGDEAGAASAVKMTRSIMLKGVEALMLECLLCSERFGVTDRVLASLDNSFPTGSWRERADYLASRTAQHAARRAEEVEEASRAVAIAGLDPLMTAAASERLGWAADRLGDRFRDDPPAGYKEVIDTLLGGRTDEDG
ncbi:MAG: DUF1932 domain-containing protein [Actinomycetota bacterium]